MGIVHVDDRSNLVDAVNRIVFRDKGRNNFGDTVVWRHNTSDWLLDADNAGGKHATFGGRLTIEDAQVRVDSAPLEIRSGQELRVYNAGNTNSANLKHSGTNDVLKTDDGVQIAGALNVGPSIVASAAGAGYFSGALTALGNASLGDADGDSHTLIGSLLARNAASTGYMLWLDVTNVRAVFGLNSGLTGASNDRLSVAGGRAYFAPNSEDRAIALRYGQTTGDFFLGATNAADPNLIFKDAGNVEVLRVGNDSDTHQLTLTGSGYVSNLLRIGSSTALTGTNTPKLEVLGGRTYLVGAGSDDALVLRYSTSSGGNYYIGATNAADPELIFREHGGFEMVRLGNGASGGPTLRVNCVNGPLMRADNLLIRTFAVTGGAAAALPANPVGYLQINMGGTNIAVPYYIWP